MAACIAINAIRVGVFLGYEDGAIGVYKPLRISGCYIIATGTVYILHGNIISIVT